MADESNIFGEEIGRGKTRVVYAHSKNPDWVVKQSVGHANQIEWKLWLTVKDTPFAKFFCPCVELTTEGHLIMVRCKPVQEDFKKIPTILGIKPPKDSKNPENYGFLDDRLVIVDYGHSAFIPLVNALKEYKKSK